MGGKSKSSSSQSTSATTTNSNQQGNTAPIATPTIKISSGKKSTNSVRLNINQTTTDFGAIEAAGEAVNQSILLSMTALEYYDKINAEALEAVSASNNSVMGFALEAIEKVDKANETEDQQNYQTLIKWVVVGSALLMIAKVYRK